MKICNECGKPYALSDSDIANHIDENGNIDYDADANHVPYGEEEA